MGEVKHDGLVKSCLKLLGLFALVRLVTLPFPALVDTTEGRYAAIAREMLIRADWIMPYIPMPTGWTAYWGKPPLYFWASAASIGVFGANEFAVRLPCFLAAVFMCYCTWLVARRFFNARVAGLSSVILCTSGFFFFLSGSCIVDFTLAAFVTGVMAFSAGTLMSHETGSRKEVWLAAVFLAAAVLTKGLIALVLCGGAIFFWLLLIRKFKPLTLLPWFSAGLVFLLLAVPWFIAAEKTNPGFLHYFFVNEHFLRYITPNYEDRYGVGHVYAYGSSLVLMLLAFMPWTFVLAWVLRRAEVWRELKNYPQRQALLYCICWGLFPALFFSVARQLTPLYILPGLPGVAILLAVIFEKGLQRNAELLLRAAFVLLLLYGVVLPGASMMFVSGRRSTGPVMAAVREQLRAEGSIDTELRQIGMVFGKPFSAYFYDDHSSAAGIEAVPVEPGDILSSGLKELIVRQNRLKDLPPEVVRAFRQEKMVGWYAWLRRG